MRLWIYGMGVWALSWAAMEVAAQPPLPRVGQRTPDDQVEGMIWEYKGSPKKTGNQENDAMTMEGKFRVEGSGIFDISPTLKLPTGAEVKKTVDKVVAGKGGELKLPSLPQQKRLGDFHKLQDGRVRLDFTNKDKDALNGIMIIWRKKNSGDGWIGTFSQREGTKTVRTWDVQLRPIED